MIRVAIIEDDPRMKSVLIDAINASGDMAVVADAETASEGSVLIDAGRYDVLLCDLGLPDGNGIDLIRRAVKRDHKIDVIVVTMFGEQRRVIDCIKAGARGYLLKDLEAETCVEAIRDIRNGGSPISPAIARFLVQMIKPEAADDDVHLSEREHDVLNMLARGFSKKECAGLLGLSVNTINTHVKHIYQKLEVNSRAEAIFEASNQGMLD